MARARGFLAGTLALGLAVAAFLFWSDRKRDPVAPYRLPLAKAQDYRPDIEFYEERLRRNPDGALDLAALASIHLRAGHYDQAEALARRSMEKLPHGNVTARLVLADLAQKKHDFRESIRLAQEILQFKPKYEGVLSILVTAHLGLGEPDEAAKYADALVEKSPGLSSYAQRALVFDARGKEREALQDFKNAIALEETGENDASAWCRAMYGRFHLRHGRLEEARDVLQESLRIVPANPAALLLLAEVEAKSGELDVAEALTVQAWESSREPAALVDRGILKARRGDRAGAEASWSRAEEVLRREVAESPMGHRGELAHLLLHRGRPEDQPEALKLAALEYQSRRNPETLENLAWALSNANKWEEARTIMRELLRGGVEDARYYHRAGLIEQKLGRPVQARMYFELAVATDPTFEPAKQAIPPKKTPLTRILSVIGIAASAAILLGYALSRLVWKPRIELAAA